MSLVKVPYDFKVDRVSRNQTAFNKDCLVSFTDKCKELIEKGYMQIDIARVNSTECLVVDIEEDSILIETTIDESVFEGYVAAPIIDPAKFHREGDITYIDEIAAIIGFNLIPRRNSLFLFY